MFLGGVWAFKYLPINYDLHVLYCGLNSNICFVFWKLFIFRLYVHPLK